MSSASELMGRAVEAGAEDEWGYFGTLRNAAKDFKITDRSEEVGRELLRIGAKESEAVDFLRSRMGRHLADAVCTDTTLGGKSVAQHVREGLAWFRAMPDDFAGAGAHRHVRGRYRRNLAALSSGGER